MSSLTPPTASDTQQSPISPPTDVQPAPQGRPRREGNDSLWKRARRTLGTNSLTFLQPQSRPTPGNKAEDASTSATGPAAPSKRREQVRHAQRTHRQRTQNYIKTLESEVVRLRGSETSLTEERDRLQGQIETLRATIMLSNIPLPPGIDPISTGDHQALHSSAPEMATVSYRDDDLSHPRLHVNWTPTPTQDVPRMGYSLGQEPMHSVSSQRYHDPPGGAGIPNLPDDFSLQPLDFGSSSYENLSTQTPFKPIDSPEVAIEFVLALEHPCMAHIPHPSNTSATDPSNHIHMVSAPLLSSAPCPPEPNTTPGWTANGTIIKELLNLASSINLEGEITPVEAWHRLRQHPDFWKLDQHGIDSLKNELCSSVRCCGFGAVLDEQTYLQAVNKYLGVGQNPYRAAQGR